MTEWENPYRNAWTYSTESFTLWLKEEQSRFVFNGRGLLVDYTGTGSFVLEAASQMADELRRIVNDIERAVATTPRKIE